jgi:hypothetical protein
MSLPVTQMQIATVRLEQLKDLAANLSKLQGRPVPTTEAVEFAINLCIEHGHLMPGLPGFAAAAYEGRVLVATPAFNLPSLNACQALQLADMLDQAAGLAKDGGTKAKFHDRAVSISVAKISRGVTIVVDDETDGARKLQLTLAMARDLAQMIRRAVGSINQ